MKKIVSVITAFFTLLASGSVCVRASAGQTYSELRLTSTQSYISCGNTTEVLAEGKNAQSGQWEIIYPFLDGEANDNISFSSSTNAITVSRYGTISSVAVGTGLISAQYTNPDGGILNASVLVTSGSGAMSANGYDYTEEFRSASLTSNMNLYPISSQYVMYEFLFYDNMTSDGGGIVCANNAQGVTDSGQTANQFYLFIGADNNISQTHYYIKDTVSPLSSEYSTGIATAVKRSAAWHKFSVDCTKHGMVYVYLDGVKIYEKQSAHTERQQLLLQRMLAGGDMIYKGFRIFRTIGESMKAIAENIELSYTDGTLSVSNDYTFPSDHKNPYSVIAWERCDSENGIYSQLPASGASYTPDPSPRDYWYRAAVTPYSYNSKNIAVEGITLYSDPVFIPLSDFPDFPETSYNVIIKETFENPESNSFNVRTNKGGSATIEDDGSGNKALKFKVPEQNGAYADVLFPFNKTVSTGKLYISYDFMVTNHSAQLFNWCSVRNNTDSVSSNTSNLSGVWNVSSYFGERMYPFNYSGGPGSFCNVSDFKNKYTTFSAILDFDTKTWEFYYDGTKYEKPQTLTLSNAESAASLIAFTVKNNPTFNGGFSGDAVYWLDNVIIETGDRLRVTDAGPKINNEKVKVADGAYFIFDSPVHPTFINKNYFTVEKNGIPSNDYKIVQSYDKKTVVVRFPNKMSYDTIYTVTASGEIINEDITKGMCESSTVSFRTEKIFAFENNKAAYISGVTSGSNITVSADITNDTEAEENIKIIFAMYSPAGKLLKTVIKNESVIKSKKVSASFELPDSEEYTFAVLAWSDEGITPLCENITASKSDAISKPMQLFVAPTGDDTNEGTIDSPLKTLEGAKNKIREIKTASSLPKGGITVNFREGIYYVSSVTEFTSADSGTEESPIVYRGYLNEKAEFSAGIPVSTSRISPASASDGVLENQAANIVKIDISDIIGSSSVTDVLGDLNYRGNSKTNVTLPDGSTFTKTPGKVWSSLVINDKVQELSRFPNEGVTEIKKTDWIKTGSDLTPQKWYLQDDAETLSLLSMVDVNELWCRASIPTAYIMSFEKIGSLDTREKTVQLESLCYQDGYIAPTSGLRRGYYFVNSPYFIDSPMEYYIDKVNKKIYLYPEEPINTVELTGSTSIISLKNTSNVQFRNLTFKNSRGSAAYSSGISNIVFDNCHIKNCYSGFAIQNSDNPINTEIKNCSFYGIGGVTISVNGGNTKTLTNSGVRIFNNTFERLGLIDFYQCNAVRAHSSQNGTPGVYVGYNTVHDTTDMTFWVSTHGIIENNEIYDAVKYGEDTGAIYMGGRNVRGRTIRNNYIHDIYCSIKDMPVHGVHGVYLDGCTDVSVYNNVFANIHNSLYKSSASGLHKVYNNVFIGTAPNYTSIKNAPIAVGDGGSSAITNDEYLALFQPYQYNSREHLIAFPEIVKHIGTTYPDETGHKIYSNILFRCNPMDINSFTHNFSFTNIENNVETNDASIFEDFENGNYNLRENSSVLESLNSFKPINMDEIGSITKRIKENIGSSVILKTGSPLYLTSTGIEAASIMAFEDAEEFLVSSDFAAEMGWITEADTDFVDLKAVLSSSGIPYVNSNGILVVNPENSDFYKNENVNRVICDLLNDN